MLYNIFLLVIRIFWGVCYSGIFVWDYISLMYLYWDLCLCGVFGRYLCGIVWFCRRINVRFLMYDNVMIGMVCD